MTMARRTYLRPMDGWWKRDPFFVRYMAREATAIFVVAYASILLVTVLRLSEGEASFGRWVDVLRSVPMVLLHVVLVIVFVYHTFSWFQIMPKTMAPVVVAGRKVPACAISAAGFAASIVASAVLFIVVRAIAS